MGKIGFKRLCCTAQFVAVLSLAGCGTVEVFGRYDLPESQAVETTPYPRLVDTPSAPARGEYSAAVPDPVQGARNQADLSAQAVVADARARDLAGPVISEEERARMLRRAKRKQR